MTEGAMNAWKAVPIMSAIYLSCGVAFAQSQTENQALSGLTPVSIGYCTNDHQRLPCVLAKKEGDAEAEYIILFDQQGNVIAVVRHVSATGRQEVVWQKPNI